MQSQHALTHTLPFNIGMFYSLKIGICLGPKTVSGFSLLEISNYRTTLLASVPVLFVFIILCVYISKGCLTETCLTYTETHTQTDTLTTDGHCINLYCVVLLFNYEEISLKL